MLQPKTGVSIAIFRGTKVLLVKRGKGFYRGLWSLPGGSQIAGETMEEAAARELAEETGLTVGDLKLVAIHEPMPRGDDGRLEAHFVLGVYAGTDNGGDIQSGDDAAAVRWAELDELDAIEMTPKAEEIIRRAHAAVVTRPA